MGHFRVPTQVQSVWLTKLSRIHLRVHLLVDKNPLFTVHQQCKQHRWSTLKYRQEWIITIPLFTNIVIVIFLKYFSVGQRCGLRYR